jgi:anti-sigma factor ChrR (cupin superfamily)
MTRKAAARQDGWIDPTTADQAMASLDMAMPPVTPPAGLWARIEQQLSADQPITVPGVDLERFAQGPWRKAYPGVRMKRLWGRHMFLLECEPGATVPQHEHGMFEHTLILSGDVTTDEGHYGAGDYFGMPAGSVHMPWSTRGGCRVLIQYDA